MTTEAGWNIEKGDSPLLAAAIHDGHSVREEVRPFLALSDEARRREEDPWTGSWTIVAPTRIVGGRSRFEVDLNRPRERAVYLEPQDSWGLKVWNAELPNDIVDRSLVLYDEFYANVETLVRDLLGRHERLVVYDLHSYNHRRTGPYARLDDPEHNPEVNLGTGTMDRLRWAPVVDRFVADLRGFEFLGRHLDVRENVRFFGGNLARWLHSRFPDSVCVLAIEFKKFFMNEWTGEGFPDDIEAVRRALESTVPGVLEELTGSGPFSACSPE